MRKLRALWMRFFGLIRTPQCEREFEAELASHIEMHTEDGIRAGLSPEEARRQALFYLGGTEQTRQAYREQSRLRWLDTLASDLVFSLRRLVKHPGATAIAVLSIGLGIGANTTIFSMVSRFVLRPPPVGQPSTLLSVQRRGENSLSWPLFHDIREQVKSFSAVAAYFPLVPASIGGEEPERVFGQAVTTNFFDVAQVRMLRGRGFAENEDNQPVILLSAGLWHRRFHDNPAIVGKAVTLSGHSFTVVGVAPVAFHSFDQIFDAQFWVPLGTADRLVPNLPKGPDRSGSWLFVIGRLRPGGTRMQAAVELKALAERLARSYPGTDKDKPFFLLPKGLLPPEVQNGLLLFLTALSLVALLVLAIAGANVPNLMLAQAFGRQREMAVRLALGATRGRLQRQMLVESVLLGLGGGGLGVLISLWATRALSSIQLPAPIPVDMQIGVDWRVVVLAFGLSICSGLLLGMAPAWAAAHPMLGSALKGEDALTRPGRRHWTLRNLLTIAQIAMSMILLLMTGLFLRSLQTAASIDIGFRPQGLLNVSVDPRLHGYTPERTAAFLNQLRKRVAALPGAISVACADYPPLSMAGNAVSFHVGGEPDSDKNDSRANLTRVTPGYFETMGIPRLAGRDFIEETTSGAKTAIVNQAFVERVFKGQNPIGQQVTGGGETYQVAGVVADVKVTTLGEDLKPVLYRSLEQNVGTGAALGYTLVIHTAGDPATMKELVRRQVHALDPSMAVFNEETMEEHVRSAFFLPRLAATLFGVFGGIGLVLATVGLYGVMSHSVSRRTREIGIRMAMGAQRGPVERLVLHQGLALTLIAMAIGWPTAWILSKLAASFLYGIQPHDALTFTAVPPFLAAIALVACWIPARRAASIEPMHALRTE
jgi:predicted permease